MTLEKIFLYSVISLMDNSELEISPSIITYIEQSLNITKDEGGTKIELRSQSFKSFQIMA